MPYYVINGVRSGQSRYVAGDRLPDGIGDQAMVEAGAIEWRDADTDAMDIKALRKAAKAAGINSFGKSADALRDELAEVT